METKTTKSERTCRLARESTYSQRHGSTSSASEHRCCTAGPGNLRLGTIGKPATMLERRKGYMRSPFPRRAVERLQRYLHTTQSTQKRWLHHNSSSTQQSVLRPPPRGQCSHQLSAPALWCQDTGPMVLSACCRIHACKFRQSQSAGPDQYEHDDGPVNQDGRASLGDSKGKGRCNASPAITYNPAGRDYFDSGHVSSILGSYVETNEVVGEILYLTLMCCGFYSFALSVSGAFQKTWR
jgi:hypothetical protein